MFEAGAFVPSLDIKTHIWIRCDGCIITAMSSHPIDKTDGRQDSWQHGTKLVWAAVPSVVCCHDRGGSYYLHGCPPSLPGRIGLVLVTERGGGQAVVWVSWKWKDGLIRAQALPLLSFLCPLWLRDWGYWLNFVHFSLKKRPVKEVDKSTWTSLVQTDTVVMPSLFIRGEVWVFGLPQLKVGQCRRSLCGGSVLRKVTSVGWRLEATADWIRVSWLTPSSLTLPPGCLMN